MKLRLLLAALTALPIAPIAALGAPATFSPAPAEDDGAAHPFALNPVLGERRGEIDADVRVNGGYRPGEVVNCHLQNEASVVAYGERVYVAYNDTSKCNDDLGLPGVRRSENGFARS